MRQSKVFVLAVILLLCCGTPRRAQSQESARNSPTPFGAVPAYPESPDGLKALIQDLLDGLTAENTDKTSAYFSSLAILDHAAWFIKMFGPDEGPRLEAKYTELLPRVSGRLSQRFSHALDGQMNDVSVTVLQKPADPGAKLDRAIFEAMARPVPIYRVNGLGPINSPTSAGPMARFPIYLGDFVFVDGAFRYIDSEVFEALSTAPQLRIRQGDKVTAASIVRQDRPEYPRDARKAHIQGSVLLHAIIATDGSVKSLEVLSGDSILAKAAMEAVKKWKYRPTMLNGQPVEVDTTITVNFRFDG
jgi:TonB family protein